MKSTQDILAGMAQARSSMTYPTEPTGPRQIQQTDEMTMLFGNRIYPEEILRAYETDISEMLKTQHCCPACAGLDTCRMLTPGLQTRYDVRSSEKMAYPVFRVRYCQRQHEIRQRQEEPRMYTVKALFQAFDNFEVTDDTRNMYDRCFDYAAHFSQFTSQGLLIVGPRGTGKSHLAQAIAKYIMGNVSVTVGFVNVPELLDEIKAGWDDPEKARNVKVSLEKRFLVLDDLGAEQDTDSRGKSLPWVVAEFYKIIDYRDQNALPTVVTTNYTLPVLEQMFPRPMDRILGMCDVVVNNAPSWRRRRPMPAPVVKLTDQKKPEQGRRPR